MNMISFRFLGSNPSDAYIAKIDTQGFFLVGIPRDKISQACKSDDIPSQGIYFLVDTKESKLEKRYLYVGQTKTGPHRLSDHKIKKDKWDFCYMFLGPKSIIHLQLVDELESLEIRKYKNNEAFNLINEKPNSAEAGIEAETIASVIEKVMTFLGYGSDESLRIYKNSKSNNIFSNSDETEKSFDVKSTQSEIYQIDTTVPLFGKKLKQATMYDFTFPVRNFKDLLLKVALECYKLNSNACHQLAVQDTSLGKKSRNPIITTNLSQLRKPIKIAENIYIESNSSSDTILHTLRIIFDACGIPYNKLTFLAY